MLLLKVEFPAPVASPETTNYHEVDTVLLEVGNFPNSGNFQGLIGTEF